VVTQSPGWEEVKTTFFDWDVFRASFPEIADAFKLNVKIFCVAEVFILAFALLLAVIRSLPGPVFFPLRALAIVYADFFRGVPTILVIAVLGFGAPALQLEGVPTSATFWGTVALVLVYTAYVSEVYRAGIDTAATFNYTPYLAAAVLFVAITIPLARFTDWLILRDRRRRQAVGVAT